MTRRFTTSHEWIERNGDIGLVGITDYAQQELGPVVYVGLPMVGQNVRAGEEVCVLESSKAATDIHSPVTGQILAVNPRIAQEPGLLNSHAETTGWLFQVRITTEAEWDALLHTEAYKSLIS